MEPNRRDRRFDRRACALAATVVLGLAGLAAPAQAQVGDDSAARKVTLHLTDFPSGWRPVSPGKLSACSAFTDLHRTATATTAFAHGYTGEVFSSVRVLADVPQARETMRRMRSDEVRRCYARELRRSIDALADLYGGRASLEAVTVRPRPGEDLGDESAGLRFTATVEHGARRVELHSEAVIVRQGRTVLVGTFATQVDTFAPRFITRLLGSAAARLGRLTDLVAAPMA